MTNPLYDLLSVDRLAAITCYSSDLAEAVLTAAESEGHPVILMVSEQAFQLPSGPRLVSALAAMAAASRCAALVQVDHIHDLGTLEAALAAGAHAVMADGSAMPFEDNVRFTAQAVAIARRYGGSVEAELGELPGDEENAIVAGAAAPVPATDPAQAAEFVDRTNVDCLAVAIGNLHGNYPAPPTLDWDRLLAISRLVNVPLALHGASGLARFDITLALRLGIRKINFNTEFRTAWFEAMDMSLSDRLTGARQMELLDSVRTSLIPLAVEKIDMVSGGI